MVGTSNLGSCCMAIDVMFFPNLLRFGPLDPISEVLLPAATARNDSVWSPRTGRWARRNLHALCGMKKQ